MKGGNQGKPWREGFEECLLSHRAVEGPGKTLIYEAEENWHSTILHLGGGIGVGTTHLREE